MGLHLFECVLRGVRVIALGEDAPCGANLDDVRTILDDFANFVLHAFDAIGHAITLKTKRGWEQILVAVAAGDTERRSRPPCAARRRHHH